MAGVAAALKYVACVYDGRIVLLQATGGNEDFAGLWRQLASGGLEVHDLPGAHLDIIHGPEARMWAMELANCLRNAQCQKMLEEEAVLRP